MVEKTVCILVEKCYHSNLKVVVLVGNIDTQENLNRLLWTYSQKQFIPHGSKLDPLPEMQPVYITNEFENPNQATVLILVMPISSQFATMLISKLELKFTRICIIYHDIGNQATTDIQKITEFFANSGYVIDLYKQNPNGSWEKK